MAEEQVAGAHMAPVVEELIAGTIGGCAGIAAGQPLDTIKLRLQAAGTPYRSAFRCLVDTVRLEGVAALYKGMVRLARARARGFVFYICSMRQFIYGWVCDAEVGTPRSCSRWLAFTFACARSRSGVAVACQWSH
jgi:hypothetical protein